VKKLKNLNNMQIYHHYMELEEQLLEVMSHYQLLTLHIYPKLKVEQDTVWSLILMKH